MKNNKIISALLFIVIALSFSACKKSTSSTGTTNGTTSIVGRWTMVKAVFPSGTNTVNYNSGSYTEYKTGGTYVSYYSVSSQPFVTQSGTYTLSGTNLSMNETGGSVEGLIVQTLDAHNLTMGYTSGVATVYFTR